MNFGSLLPICHLPDSPDLCIVPEHPWCMSQGRKPLFIVAGVQMTIGLLIICFSLYGIGVAGTWLAWYTLGFICFYDM